MNKRPANWRLYAFRAAIGILALTALLECVAFLRWLALGRFVGVREGNLWLEAIGLFWAMRFFLGWFGAGRSRIAALIGGALLALPFTLNISW
jgi:hypothetical protein